MEKVWSSGVREGGCEFRCHPKLNLFLPPPSVALTSASQLARVSTEAWASENFYCGACGADLVSYPSNTMVYDFHSPECGERFQLKSSSRPLTGSVLGAGYKATIESIMNDAFPSLILLHYDRARWVVDDLSLVHRACITTSCIAPRAPLSSTARRAGWQGYTITLQQIPAQGKIDVVSKGRVRQKSDVLAQWRQTNSLFKSKPETRGWLTDVLRCVEKCFTTFTLSNIYMFESELAAKHPENHNVKAKIRQQLQILRDLRLIEFLGSGEYRRISPGRQ